MGRPLAGAFPAPAHADEEELIGFYAEVTRGLHEVRRDGRERRDWRR